MGSLEHQLAITTSELKMKFLIAFSAVLAVALAAPANVYSPYLLQDLAYQSVDANEDGQIDQAISITHPTQIMRAIATNMPAMMPAMPMPMIQNAAIAMAAPKWEVKQIETPAELKTLPMTYTMPAMMPAMTMPMIQNAAITMAAPKWEVKKIETPAELKTLPMTYAMQPMMFRSALTSEIKTDIPQLKTLPTYSYGTYPFAPFTIVKTAEKSE